MEGWFQNVPRDPFKQLGVDRNSTPITIKKRYYHLAKKYHPNRNTGPEESNKALSEHFNRIHEAWLLLEKANLRRRYLEFIQLVELHDELLDKQEELGDLDEREPNDEDWSSSDADEFDLSHLSSISRAKSPAGDRDPTVEGTGHLPDIDPAFQSATPGAAQCPRGREPDRRKTHPPFQNARSVYAREGSDGQSTEHRRHKLSRRWAKELQAFDRYRDAVMAKLRAEEEMEKCKEKYEHARKRREKIENMPREAIETVQMSRQVVKAIKMFKRGKPRLSRRPTLSLRSHLASAGDPSRDPGYLTVGSPSTTRGIPSHWRGYSSDVSGDQTSSDDDGSIHGAPRRHLRSPSTKSRRRSPAAASSGASHDASPLQQSHVNGNERSDSRPPFQLLVKRPTGFEDPCDHAADDSTGDSNSIGTFPSRSSSPRGINHCRDLIVFPTDNSTAIMGAPGHRRTMSAPGQTVSHKDSDPDMSRPHHQGPMFEVKIVNETKFPDKIPKSHVYKLSLGEESRLLKPPQDFGTLPDELLQKLTLLDPGVAKRFVEKPDVKSQFAFRLICNNKAPFRQPIPSFIALSYRRKRLVERNNDYYTLPLDKAMLQAVWEERYSDAEGLWVDQVSINQDSDYEKTISMSAMDMVYRSARLVVVVLDDVELREHEGTVLELHIKEYEAQKHVIPDKRFRRYQPPYLETHEPLMQVLQKILTSAWFRRAWCRHEMRLARDHVFLLPCHTAGSFKQTVLRLTSACIAHLLALATEVPFDASIEMLKPALHAFFRDRTQSALTAPADGSHHGNFSTVIAEVFAMETGGDPRLPAIQRDADARRDKVSIILNTMECGLALHPQLRSSQIALSKEDCYYSLLLLALAAGDPGALCSVGKPMHIPLQPSAHADRTVSSWLFEPTNVDSGLNNYKTLNRLAADQRIHCNISRGSHYVQLDLKFLPSTIISLPTKHEEIFGLAKDFIAACEKRKMGRHRRRYLINDLKANELFGSMREVYIETLACVFICGPDWMEQVAHRYGVSRFRQDLQPATWLMVALRNMNGTWPAAEWVTRGAAFIMDLVNFLVIRGMPQRQLRHPEGWRPIIVATSNGGRIVTFRPPGDDVQLVVPTALLNADYDHLARLWMMTSRTTESKWCLLGKSVMFSDDLGLLQVNDEGDMVRRQQKVYGRTLDMSGS